LVFGAFLSMFGRVGGGWGGGGGGVWGGVGGVGGGLIADHSSLPTSPFEPPDQSLGSIPREKARFSMGTEMSLE